MAQEGHARVPHDHVTTSGYRLWSWVSRQRTIADDLSRERRLRLEALPGWSWDANAAKWDEGFRHLKEFAEREGHAYVPTKFRTADGYPLGIWTTAQRNQFDELPPERKARLESLPTWTRDSLDQWIEKSFEALFITGHPYRLQRHMQHTTGP